MNRDEVLGEKGSKDESREMTRRGTVKSEENCPKGNSKRWR